MNHLPVRRRITGYCLISAALFTTISTAFALVPPEGERPAEFDVRGFDGVPKGTELRQPNAAQLKAIASLEGGVSGPLVIQYNGLTATPRHLLSHSGPLSEPSAAPPELIARDFLHRWRAIWRFSEDDLRNLRLRSRVTLPDTGTTVLLFEQHVDGVSVYKGEVLVNVNRAGQVISVGNENFPEMTVTNSFAISPAAAVTAAATDLGVAGFAPQSLGTTNVLRTFGDLPHEFTEGTRFAASDSFTDEIVVTRVVFPMGNQGRAAYHLGLLTPQYDGTKWDNIVDAQTGAVLRRISLTSFQEPAGGPQNSRRGTFRPDIQNMVEGFPLTSAVGKAFDGAPTGMSGSAGFGRPTRAELPKQPGYAPDTATTTATGVGFRRGLVFNRSEFPFAEPGTLLFALVNGVPFGQVTRGFPDALNPTPESPFGWFYLPTDDGGVEVNVGDTNRGSTRAFGYNMHANARTRNRAANSPATDNSQPFSADLTTIPSITIRDGRTLPAVFQSRYTEGNNVLTADDKDNDNETTHGIKGYAEGRQFTRSYFDFESRHEIDNQANPDVFPATLTLFYYNNILHDYLYSIGFTEATWNFQEDNFGEGGAGRDAVSTQVQDGNGTNNANFLTEADGTRSRMQMYLFTDATFRRADGDFDFDVVAHELYHGVSNRSVGKGSTGCLGLTRVGESNGMGEGWSDYIANSFTDDDVTGEYATGRWDIAIRKLPNTNFRYSYRNITGTLSRRDQQPPDTTDTNVYGPFLVHDVGEHWSATLWDMRELLIVKQEVNGSFPGIFFDGTRRIGDGTNFYIGYRQVKSVDTQHPIDYRASFNTGRPASINPAAHIVRPREVTDEIEKRRALNDPDPRGGPLATAVIRGGRLADTIVLRGMQLAPCNPSFVDMRDSMLLADREMTAGENQAIIWRAFASHGVGLLAASSNATADPTIGTQNTPIVVEDFSVPAGVAQCEAEGPLAHPIFSLSNVYDNEVLVTITPAAGAATYVISRATSATGPFVKIAEIPATQTTYPDNDGGEGLVKGQTYYYQVRATRSAECVSGANTSSITITVGEVLEPAPLFFGINQVGDPRMGNRLILSWFAATSLNPEQKIVYDIYRVSHVDHGTGQNDPTFTPSAANRIAEGVTGTSYVDTGLTLNQVYYYIVQARDTDPANGKKDTNNTGNRVAKWSAPTITCVRSPAPFALETFEDTSADNRFLPPLVESTTDPNQDLAAFQRITVAGLGHPSVGKMYAPNFSPGHENSPGNCGTVNGCGGASNFHAQIGPFNGEGNPPLTGSSILEFDHAINAEARFDGAVLEVKLGTPFTQGEATPYPDNVNVFDLGDYIIDGGYNSKLDGTFDGVVLSPLQGRRAYTGIVPLHHVRVSLRNFAPGGLHNPQGLPVYIRFRMTSDAATANGVDAGWFIDNLVVNNMGGSGTVPLDQVVSRKSHGDAGTFEVPLPLTGASGVESRTGGANGDHTVVFKFGTALAAVGNATVTGGGTVSSHGYDQTTQEYVVNLTGVPNAKEITVTLTGVNDACGNTAASIAARMGVLFGDVNATRIVDGNDVSATQAQTRQRASNTNFRADVNTTGVIDGNDVSAVQSRTRTRLP